MCFPSQHCHQQTTKSCFPLEDDSMNQRDNPISPWFARFMVPQTSQKQVEKIHHFQALTRWCLKEQQGTYDWMLGRKWSDQWWVRINGFFHLLIWLVVEPTPLKNMLKSNWKSSSPGIRGEKYNIFELPPPSYILEVYCEWRFLVPLIGGRYNIIPQLVVYTTYIPLIYCLLGDYISPTTY